MNQDKKEQEKEKKLSMELELSLKKNFKNRDTILALIFLLIIGFLIYNGIKTISFEEGSQRMLDLDKKYSTSFRTEKVNVTSLEFDEIEAYIKELEAFY